MERTCHIEIGGSRYPARMVMGALLMYRRETGEDASAMKADDLEAVLMLLWCCVAATCRGEGIEFPYDFERFCDLVTPADVARWNEAMTAGGDGEGTGGEKKTPGGPT